MEELFCNFSHILIIAFAKKRNFAENTVVSFCIVVWQLLVGDFDYFISRLNVYRQLTFRKQLFVSLPL